MRLVFHIKILSLFILVLTGTNVYANSDTIVNIKYKIESKYRTEYSPYFKFNTFQRGANTQTLKLRLDSLSNKPKNKWKRHDSILFAKTNLLAGNTNLAEHYFSHIKIHPKYNFNDNIFDIVAIYKAKNYKKGTSKIKKNYPKIIQYSKMYFIKSIFEAQINATENPTWYKSKPKVFNFTFDTLLTSKNKERFKNEIIAPLNVAHNVLQLFVKYIHEDDMVLARAFNDVGKVLEKQVSLSQAYIAYSIGRNYNKKDKAILQNIKNVKAKILLKNYKIPNFRKYFPRIEEWRFDYEILKEKIIFEKNDTIQKHSPILRPKKLKPKLPFSADILVPAGIALIFLFILIFIRTRKK